MSEMKIKYYDWRVAIEREIEYLIGLNSECFPDYDFMRAFEQNKKPEKVAREIIFNAVNF